MTENRTRCADCRFWEYRNNNFGFCRANPPTPTIVKGSTTDEYTLVWPSTGRDDWCGRFDPVRSLEVKK